jgi:hypothetical protein
MSEDFAALHRIYTAYGVAALLAVAAGVFGYLAPGRRADSSTILRVARIAAALLIIGDLFVLMVDATAAFYLFSARLYSCLPG